MFHNSIIFILLKIGIIYPHSYCIRKGATDSGNGSDWTNAYISLPLTLSRGDSSVADYPSSIVLATSTNTINTSTLDGTPTWTTFTFSGYNATSGNEIWPALGGTGGGAENYPFASIDEVQTG